MELASELLAGLGLVVVGLATGPRWVLVGLGAGLVLPADYDRLLRR
jgi:hypothetical protein